MRTTAAVRAAAQSILGADSYLVVFGPVAVLGLVTLLTLLGRRQARSGLRLPLTRSEEFVALLCALGVGIAGFHELVTDRLCHGACI